MPNNYEVQHGEITIHVYDHVDSKEQGMIIVTTLDGSSAELCDLQEVEVYGLSTKPVYYFNRIRVRPDQEGTGRGKAMMIEVCKLVDKHGITIFNQLNPYGGRDLEELKEFFKASGFENFISDDFESVMIRKPQGKNE